MASVAKRTWTTPAGLVRQAYEVRWLENGRHRAKGGFRLKKDADAFSRRVEDDRAAGRQGVPHADITMSRLVDLYIKGLEDKLIDGRVSRTRMKNIRNACDRAIVPRLGAVKLRELTPLMIEDWYVALVKERGLAPTTAKGRVQELKLVCAFGQRRGFLAVNPVPDALRELRNVRAAPVRVPTLDEVRAILRTIETPGKWGHPRANAFLRCAVHLAAFCGLRQGEILGLKLRHVNFAKRTIEVRHSLTHFDEIKGPKTAAGRRDVPFPAHVGVMLKGWIDDHMLPEPRGLVFTNRDGGRISGPRMTSWQWARLLRRAGLWREADNLHFHSLRHFAASWWLHHGMAVTDTASLMGHAAFDITLQIYAHPIVGGNARHEAFERLTTGLLIAPGEPIRTQTLRTTGQVIENDDPENMVTILAEERLALAIYRPQALIKGTFTGAA